MWLGGFALGVLKPGFERYAGLFTGLIPVFAMYAAVTYYSKILIAAKRYSVNGIMAIGVAIFVLPTVFFPQSIGYMVDWLGTDIMTGYALLLASSVAFALLGTIVLIPSLSRQTTPKH